MSKLYQTFVAIGLALSIVACSGSGGGSKNGGENNASGNNLPTYTEEHVTAELKNLNSTEKGLENVGLKFKTVYEYRNGLSTNTISFDPTFVQDFLKNHPSVTKENIISSLENYVKVANAYIQKYSNPFNLKKTDGSVEEVQLTDSQKKELDSKVSVANQLITKLKAS
jgi:hypothetical protein